MGGRKITIEIPTCWKDITIEMYQKYIKKVENEGNILKKENKTIEVLCKLDKKTVNKIPFDKKSKIITKLNKFLSIMPGGSGMLANRVMFKGVEHGFIPNLSKITTGEYIDIDSYCKDTNDNLHKIMSVLYRPITKKYKKMYSIEAYDPDEFKEEKFKQFPMSFTLSAIDFFFYLGKTLMVDINNSLQKELTKRSKTR